MKSEERRYMRNTSLLLIVLTLIPGVALGWLLRDWLGSAPLTAPTPAPLSQAAAQPAATPAPAPTTPPTALPIPSPTSMPMPLPTPSPTPAPTAQAIAGYIGHQVAPGETLEAIAAAGGSTAELIAHYNLLDGNLQPGRALIVPQLTGMPSRLVSEPLLVQKGPAGKPWVALTLDAGASADPVPGMLATLRKHHVRLTFFLTGKWIEDNPELTHQIIADGHEIANHSFNHPDMRKLSDDAIREELADTEALLAEIGGASTRPFFRPPFGAYDTRVLRLVEAEGYVPIYWTFDSLDSVGEPKTADFLLDRITNHLPPEQLPGAIILAHCGSQPTADALPRILDRFAEMGIEVKKLSAVLDG
jgi:peptidoglycan/xylan/chitin deacetylase (PgdA/CDA1 family)